ncbi:peptidase M24, structural domain-containing protein [Gaertneriomyces semiglobifer]|nr:peptidase M24, structural domain-containing protein [Gaertneriomyces semiglobifer]
MRPDSMLPSNCVSVKKLLESQPSLPEPCTTRKHEGNDTQKRPVNRWSLAICLIYFLFFYPGLDMDTGISLERKCPFSPPTLASPLWTETRARLTDRLAGLPGWGENEYVIALPTGTRAGRVGSDMEAPWRVAGDAGYIGEWWVSDSIVLLTPKNDTEGGEIGFHVSLFLPNQTQRELVFSGFPDLEKLREDYGLAHVQYLGPHLVELLAGRKVLVTTYSLEEVAQTLGELKDKIDLVSSDDLTERIIASRFTKTAGEMTYLAFASKVAAWVQAKMEAHITGSRRIQEEPIKNAFEYLSTVCYAQSQAYNPIVAAGRHASVLHYRTGEAPISEAYKEHRYPNFVLIDAAGQVANYASDMTRTYAIRDTWRLFRSSRSRPMKIVHKIVSDAQAAGVDYFDNAKLWADVEMVTIKRLVHGLVHHGFFVEGVTCDDVLREEAWRVFMPHGVGHSVGLDVHDPIPSKFQSSSPLTTRPHLYNMLHTTSSASQLSINFTITPGVVMTIEPGVYFIPSLWSLVRSLPEYETVRDMINWDIVEQKEWVNVGGVRIEDVVAVDVEGRKRVLTREH